MLKTILKAAFWVVGSVIIPATVWFTLINRNVEAHGRRLDQHDKKIEQIEKAAIDRDLEMAQRFIEQDRILANKMEEIQRSLGRIEGRVKAIHEEM